MDLRKLSRAVFSESGLILVSGVAMILISWKAFDTGYVKGFFPLGNSREPYSIALLLIGIWLIIMGIKSVINNYKK